MALRLFSRKSRRSESPAAPRAGADIADPGEVLRHALRAGRFGFIIARPECCADSGAFEELHRLAAEAIDQRFCLVPEGYASIVGSLREEASELDFETEPFLLARYAVTNGNYQQFVDDGGYRELQLWPEDIWPQMIDFTDLSGQPGPRFWKDGRHATKLTTHPVVGVSYYEAAAFARWAGFRLPTEAEWQMAASWRLRSAANAARRYPWGDALDLKCCNIWASGHGRTQPVDACPGGAAPNGVAQLIGNVWEWTSSQFGITDEQDRPIVGDSLLRSIRGGAFDTYFPWQATSEFSTGLTCLTRSHNVGFRCALDLPTT